MADEPELVIDALAPTWLPGLMAAGVVGALLAAPIIGQLAPINAVLGERGPLVIAVGFGLIGALAWQGLSSWFDARHGRVELHGDRVVFAEGTTRKRLDLPWTAVRGYKDGSSEHVELVRVDGYVPFGEVAASLGIPTPTPELRAALLALLERRGLRRLDEEPPA